VAILPYWSTWPYCENSHTIHFRYECTEAIRTWQKWFIVGYNVFSKCEPCDLYMTIYRGVICYLLPTSSLTLLTNEANYGKFLRNLQQYYNYGNTQSVFLSPLLNHSSLAYKIWPGDRNGRTYGQRYGGEHRPRLGAKHKPVQWMPFDRNGLRTSNKQPEQVNDYCVAVESWRPCWITEEVWFDSW
jgi:hypothetical protein